MELNEKIYNRICALCETGDAYFEKDKYQRAVEKYQNALSLVPEPKVEWEASTWIYVALGEVYYYCSQYSEAMIYFGEAEKCPGGIENPLINLRLGQCYCECDDSQLAKEYLLRAYMLEGESIFEDEDEKYFELIKDDIEKVNDSNSNVEYKETSIESAPVVTELYKKGQELMDQFNQLCVCGKIKEAREVLFQAWEILPDNKYESDESYWIVANILDLSMELRELDVANEWVDKIFLCDPERPDTGEREMWAGKVAYVSGKIEKAKKYFDIAYQKSSGRNFVGENAVYRDLLSTK